MFDILISGGTVIDGTGAPPVPADVGVAGDRIAAIGRLEGASAGSRIDATGLVVAPGFIDLHTHSDFSLLVDGAADSQIRQGVTTEIIGQCGHSTAPWSGRGLGQGFFGFVEADIPLDWRSFAEYLDRLEAARPAVNVGALVGHGALVEATEGAADRLPALLHLAEDALAAGALGVSTGLEYWPGNEAPAAEIVALARVAGRRGALYATHVRNRDVDYAAGFGEAIETARAAVVRLQISHIQPKYGAPPDAIERTFDAIAAAERDGVDVAFDVIPHEWSHTYMMASVPAWARAGGIAATLARLADPAERARIKAQPAPIWRLVLDQRWDDIVLLRADANPELVGETMRAIGQERGVDPFDAALDLMLEAGTAAGQVMWTSRNFRDRDICRCLGHANCSVMSDTLALSRDGPLKGMIGSLSGYGWVARLLGHYVRERGVLSLEAAIERITSRPADRLRLNGRGRLAIGAFADIAVFDPATVADQASVRAPTEHPTGFHTTIVNGAVAFADGARTGARTGRVLRRNWT